MRSDSPVSLGPEPKWRLRRELTSLTLEIIVVVKTRPNVDDALKLRWKVIRIDLHVR